MEAEVQEDGSAAVSSVQRVPRSRGCSAAALEIETETQASKLPAWSLFSVSFSTSCCAHIRASMKPCLRTPVYRFGLDKVSLCSHSVICTALPTECGLVQDDRVPKQLTINPWLCHHSRNISLRMGFTIWSDSLISTGANSSLTHSESNQAKGWVPGLSWFQRANAVLWPGFWNAAVSTSDGRFLSYCIWYI